LLIPAGVALGAIFIGNIFAHSMLVRENLFIAACFIGLMYACMKGEQTSAGTVNFHSNNKEHNFSAYSAKAKFINNPIVISAVTIFLLVCLYEKFIFHFDQYHS